MKFFAIDQHISVIADLKNLFGRLGHTIDDVCLSGHACILGRKQDSIPMLDGDKWCGFVKRQAWDEFSALYPNLDEYDGFICCYPPIFSYLYRNFKKPIIIDIPIRYEYPCQSDADDWIHFNEYLRAGVDAKRIYLLANNLYDKKYTELFVERPVQYIPSMCLYTGMKYDPKRNQFLYNSACPYPEFEGTNFKRKHDVLPFGHPWQAVAEYAGVVHFPYNVSTMSTFEQYAANIPMFCPSLDLVLKMYASSRRHRVLEQTSWVATFGRPSGSVVPVPDGMPDPNDYEDIDGIRYWLQYADYWNREEFPDIIHFDSFDELFYKAMHADLAAISESMQWTNTERLARVLDSWKILLERVKNGQGM